MNIFRMLDDIDNIQGQTDIKCHCLPFLNINSFLYIFESNMYISHFDPEYFPTMFILFHSKSWMKCNWACIYKIINNYWFWIVMLTWIGTDKQHRKYFEGKWVNVYFSGLLILFKCISLYFIKIYLGLNYCILLITIKKLVHKIVCNYYHTISK